MAAPVIAVNLTDIDLADESGTWNNIGGGSPTAEGDYYIQRASGTTGSVSGRVSNGTGGFYVIPGPTRDGTGANHIYIWLYATGTAALDLVDNGGLGVWLRGSSENNYYKYYVDGSDTNLTGGWKCYTVDPANFPDEVGGAGITTSAIEGFGVEATTIQSVTGRNIAADAVRIGTGLTVYAGDTSNKAGFTSVTDENDLLANQYGVFAATDTGAAIQGELSIGLDDATTETYFEDTTKTIVNRNKNPRFGNTNTTASDFTGIKIQGGLTTCILNNTTFASVDPHDKGYFDCGSATNTPGNVDLDGCIFQGWGPTTLSGNTAATNTTWIGCEPVTLNSGTLDNCTVEAGIGGTYVIAGSTPNNISNTSFIGVNTTDTGATGYGHAIEITSSGSYDFVNNSFVGFDTTGSAGAAIHIIGSGVDVTLNISGNDATASPTYKLSDGAVDPTFNAAVTVNVTGLPVVPAPQDATEIRVLVAGQDLFATATGIGTTDPDVGIGTETHRTSTFSFGIAKDFDFDLRIINLDYSPQFISSVRAANDPTNVSANMKADRVSTNEKQ